jgi:hypothetical protein
VAGTWVREDEGVLRELVISKTDATWHGPWVVGQSDEDWEKVMESLKKNMQASNVRLEEDGDCLRVI